MEKEEFLQAVKEELQHIKSVATPEEIGRLDFDKFDGGSPFNCIYGQMTGRCSSVRAKEIFPKSFFEIFSYNAKGDYNTVPFEDHSFAEGGYYTALEKYLYSCGPAMHLKIYDFLKGKTDEITLTIESNE